MATATLADAATNSEVTVALIAAGGAVLVAFLGLIPVFVQLRRSRQGNEKDHKAVLIELAALQETQDETRADIKEVRDEQREQGERLARVEGQLETHLYDRIERVRRR